MRKLKLQVQMTVDGYIAGINGEMDWTARAWDDNLKKYVGEITEPVDCIILTSVRVKQVSGLVMRRDATTASSVGDSTQSGRTAR